MPHSATYRGDGQVEVNVKLLRETDKAYQFDIGRNSPVWVAKSQITDQCEENGRIISIFVPEWLATEKGMV